MIAFESSNIKYREMTLDDTASVLKWRNSEAVKKVFFYQKTITEEEHTQYYKDRILTGKTQQFIMIDKASGTEFGCVYLSGIDYNKCTAESGIFIGEERFKGKKYGTEAIKAIANYGFNKLKLNRIDIRIKATNDSSIESHKKVGYIENRDLINEYEYNGDLEDVIFMSLYLEDRK